MSQTPHDDQVLREYLLGRLAPDSRTRVEDRLFSNDRIFWEHLSLVEDELISDFARGALEGADRADFLERFACTEERRSRVEFARALQGYVEHRQARDIVPVRTANWTARRLSLPSWAAAAAALVLLVLGGAIMQRLAPGAPVSVAVTLTSGLTRGEGALARVRVEDGTQTVRFQLDLGAESYATYRATLHEVSGGEIWSQSNLAPAAAGNGAAIVVVLPGEVLPAGDYFFSIDGLPSGAPPVPLPRYDFRVLRD